MRASKIVYFIIGAGTLLGALVVSGCTPTVTHALPHDAEYQQFQSDRAQRQLDADQ